MVEFKEFPKIPRLNREIIVSEKIDGTNAAVVIEQAEISSETANNPNVLAIHASGLIMLAQSRNRFILPAGDNHGFAAWVKLNAAALWALGPGVHYGEWWGVGINKRYNQQVFEKRFSLFNSDKWTDPSVRPPCCHVVPVLYRGKFDMTAVGHALGQLQEHGSVAAPGCMKPEGIIIYHTAARALFKVTCESDESYKGVSGG